MLPLEDPCDHHQQLEGCLKTNVQLKQVMDSTSNIYLLLDQETKLLYCSKSFLRFLGIKNTDEILGKSLVDILEKTHNEDFLQIQKERYVQMISGMDWSSADKVLNWPTVGKRTYRITFRRLSDVHGELDKIIIIFTDITDVRLEEAQRRVKDLLHSTLMPTEVWDEHGNIIEFNKRALRVFGLPETLSADEYNQLITITYPKHQADGKSTTEIRDLFLHEALDKGFAQIEIQLKKSNGTELPLGVTASRIEWLSGYRLLVYYSDLTDIKAKEARAREIDERTKLIMDAMPLSCTIFDENCNVLDSNTGSHLLFNMADNQSYNTNFFKLSPEFQPDGELSTDKAIRMVREALAKGKLVFEWEHKTLDGEHIPCEVTLVRIKQNDSYLAVGYARDLRELKKIQAETDEANTRIRLMLDSLPLICILRDDHFNVIDCNQETLKVLGIKNKSDILGDLFKFYPEFQPDGKRTVDMVCDIKNQMMTNNETHTFEWTFKTVDGTLLPVESTLVRIPWKNSFCFLSFSRDLVKIKEQEQKIRESDEENRNLEIQKEAAQAASEAKSHFLASMSHEIRTPMNTIIGLLELIRTDNLDTMQTKYIRDVRYMSDVLLQIINDILDFNKIEAGKVELIPTHFNLSTFYDAMVSRHQYLAGAKSLIFNSHLAPDMPRTLLGDELRIGQIIANLISNAIKYTPQGFVNFNITEVEEDGQPFVSIIVEDSGIGIKKENFATLFEEFEQFDSHKNRGITGTGLGLSIAKRLVDMMHGKILVDSEYGKGTKFTVLLPLVKGDPEKVELKEEIERVIVKPDTKVLVVDDNAGNITVAIGMLARHGIFPDTANNGRQAVEMIKANKYDLVFMDHMMPVMDGIEATTIIRKMDGDYFRDLPIIALSANAIDTAQEQFMSCGMNDFVSKPIINSELNFAIARWLPPEKIAAQETMREKETSPSSENLSQNKQLQELTKIEDLSLINGLSRVGGDKNLYIEVLRQFCKDAEGDIDALKQFAKQGKWKDYAIRVHGVKSVFATIGNQFMSDWAFRLE
ncbi:MAG: PAS domain-containing protein, partial [Planctomycetaceae bacterium]|nr:PAS domain-containing protein [Planctomycetaceae bacterium]